MSITSPCYIGKHQIFGGDIVFQKSNTKNMDKLWGYFHSKDDYPEYYLGKVEKMVQCRCPTTNMEEYHNARSIEFVGNLRRGTELTAYEIVNNEKVSKKTTFIRWEPANFYEWRMSSGNIMTLRQEFIDTLLPGDKRYLKMTR
jgi:hypothetical protein